MSGIDERPDIMPKCECGNLKIWIVRGLRPSGSFGIMWINIDDDCRRWYGKWNTVSGKYVDIMGRASYMYCDQCGVTASSEDLARAMTLFERECLDCD